MIDKPDFINVREINHYYKLLNKDFLLCEKPLLVFLHEGLGSIAQWKDFPELLSDKTECPALVYDRYGHGLSEELKEKRDINFIQEQAQVFLPELLQNLGFDKRKIILIGHSDGGSIAIVYAGSFPENIAGIITEAAHLFIEEISSQGIRDALKLFEEGRLRRILQKYHHEKTEKMFYGWAHTWLKPEACNWNIESCVKKINAPFLAIQGADDQYGSVEQLNSVRKNAANTQTVLIPECGHSPHLQRKQEVLQIMSDFIFSIVNN